VLGASTGPGGIATCPARAHAPNLPTGRGMMIAG
jgi:hypothetical protein